MSFVICSDQSEISRGNVTKLRVFGEPLKAEIICTHNATIGSTALSKIDLIIRANDRMIGLMIAFK